VLSIYSGAGAGRSVGLRGEPDGHPDDRAEREDPDEQALRDGAEAAELQTAGRRVVVEVLEVGDDVGLVLGRDVEVAEDGMFCGR